jgi:hypothetical protein
MVVANNHFRTLHDNPQVEGPGEGIRVRLRLRPPQVFVSFTFVKEGEPEPGEPGGESPTSPTHTDLPTFEASHHKIVNRHINIDPPNFLLALKSATLTDNPIYRGSPFAAA